MSILQNLKIPQFISEENLRKIFGNEVGHACLMAVRKAYKEMGIFHSIFVSNVYLNLF